MTAKHVVLTCGALDDASKADLLADHGAWAKRPGVSGLVVNVVREVIQDDPQGWPDPPAVAAMTEVWTEGDAFGDLPRSDEAVVCRVEGYAQKQRPMNWGAGSPSPGRKNVFLVRRRPGCTAEAFRDHWLSRHVPLALRHHVGMCAYVTDVVAGSDNESLAFDGLSHLTFPSEQAFVDGMYDSDEGMQVIAADVSRFVGAAVGLRVEERVFLVPEQGAGQRR
jgi:uncharacterized protein (TIGR02118 family)